MAYSQKKRQKRHTSKWLYLAAIVVVVAGVVGVLELTHTIHLFHHAVPAPTGPETKGEVGSNSSSSGSQSGSGSSSNGSGQTKSSSNAASASGSSLITPSGEFVSDHHPNLSGSPAPNKMASDCTTTPGATCQITFTMNGVTKSLASQTTNAQGTAYWSWTLQSAGLTQGTWTVKATATLGGNTLTATDAEGLVVAQ